jgi:TatD DNase family protein
MFDSHCHLDASEYDADRSDVLARARAAGVTGILIPGYEPEEWRTLAALCATDSMLCCGVGLHPWYVRELDDAQLGQALDSLPDVLREQRAVAVGECGLDMLHAKRESSPIERQEQVLARHLTVARELGLPLILHCVKAHERMLTILEKHGPFAAGGVMHSYSGPEDLVPRYAKLGLSFSFAGVVTREEARRPRMALAAVPLERLLVESDGPDQAPRGAESTRSEPRDIVRMLEVASELRSVPLSELARATGDNARALFARG